VRHAKKRLGQHFLCDERVVAQIIDAFPPVIPAEAGIHVIEIGPGMGALTGPLLAQFHDNLTCIEIDQRMVNYLKKKYPRLNIIHADILKTPLSTSTWIASSLPRLTPRSSSQRRDRISSLRTCEAGEAIQNQLSIIGNLPYNISTPILFHLFQYINNIHSMLFMLQEEVVDRITAAPNSKNYGRLSVMCQAYCTVEKLFTIAPDAFDPPPKVNSAIVSLIPNPINCHDFNLLEKIVRIAFNQRRKTIANNLRDLFNKDVLLQLNIDPTLRPENLSVENYATLANYEHLRNR
jgi:16S rRNA (adenine1518-N6/adenine1519-N6)-dimethyltransferase